MEEPHYLCGIAAGRTTKTGKLGFIGGKPIFIFNNCKRHRLRATTLEPITLTCLHPPLISN